MAECTDGSGRFFQLILEHIFILGGKNGELSKDQNMIIFYISFLTACCKSNFSLLLRMIQLLM